jgi:hypothetical protein
VPLLLSSKDSTAPTLATAAAHGLAPDYQACLAYYAQLDAADHTG